VASERTNITELATAAGMMLGRDFAEIDLVEALELPGIDDARWRPWLEPAAEGGIATTQSCAPPWRTEQPSAPSCSRTAIPSRSSGAVASSGLR
jgi:hypothetical protein